MARRKQSRERLIEELVEAAEESPATWETVIRQVVDVMPDDAIKAALEEVVSPPRRFRVNLGFEATVRTAEESIDTETLVDAVIQQMEEHEEGAKGWLRACIKNGSSAAYVGIESPSGDVDSPHTDDEDEDDDMNGEDYDKTINMADAVRPNEWRF